ncbi:hypothetical protein CR162_04545 [Pseudoroseomonas rhizosphaerae]|uniref:Uncharacterized protein n=1 Tax=Teichococcus rhizosphaerae TaxID=1335062 RepID=A0A2C7AF92_9PROT|nr:hypothetical protein [Pseudoroseomonas rhizosphaerae]PHK96115.1 hypothetical protein CR162_04545 [Pseudoroseomonas rhizosphaerae]
MTDTPKDSPKGEPVPGSRNAPPKGRPGRENPTVTPRAFSGINPAAKPAPEAARPAAPPASAPPASAPPAPAAPASATPPVAPPSADAPPAAPSAGSVPASASGGMNPTPPAAPAGASGTSPGPTSSPAPGMAPGPAPAAPAPSALPAKPAAAHQPASRPPAPAQETAIPPVPTPPRPATPQDSSPPRMTKPTPTPPAPPARPRGRLEHLALPIAAASGVAALLALGISLANRPGPTVEPARLEALEQQMATLQPVPEQLRALQPVPEQLRALQPLPQRLQALESGPLAQAGQRLGALEAGTGENRQAVAALREQLQSQRSDREALERAANARIEEAERNLAQRISGAEAQIAQRLAAAEAALGPRFAAVEESMRQRVIASEDAARERNAARDRALDERFAALEARESRLAAAERRLSRLIASAGVETALEAGRPLGQALSGLGGEAPAALRRYAEAAPPTEASLRLSFEDAARAARARAEPATEGQSVWESAATRLGNLVTVRRGENVVWGDSVSGELETARRALEAGDLPAAIRRIEGLPEPVRAPMGQWLEQARGLVAARGALSELRSGGQG